MSQIIPQPLKSKPIPFNHPDYLFKLKYDGFRAVAHLANGKCQLLSRNGSVFASFSTLAARMAASLPLLKSARLDGEIVCVDQDGRPRFRDQLFHRTEPCFFAFDLLGYEGRDLKLTALIERKAELRRILARAPDTSRIRYADHIERNETL